MSGRSFSQDCRQLAEASLKLRDHSMYLRRQSQRLRDRSLMFVALGREVLRAELETTRLFLDDAYRHPIASGDGT
jgi:hypothetical protein